jgi:hypothetical protein
VIEDTTPINLEPAEEPDPEQVLAERRRKRAEILAKYAKKDTDSNEGVNTNPPTPKALATIENPKEEKRDAEEKSVSTPGRIEVERAAKRLKLGTGQSRSSHLSYPSLRS